MTTDIMPNDSVAARRPLLLVDDDQPFRDRLMTTLDRSGFVVTGVGSLAEARQLAPALRPSHAVIDLRLGDGNGLAFVDELRALDPQIKIVILTGYGSLATAVAAAKAGAVDYLTKPADPEDIIRALNALLGQRAEPPTEPMSTEKVRWEHIQRVHYLADHNISETARRLKMHRRTLQRVLAKGAPV
jgi:two-component system response regulator RegA